jgi:hypothetical protein
MVGAPRVRVVDERLRQALAQVERPDTPIEYRTVTTPEQAEELRFCGSPGGRTAPLWTKRGLVDLGRRSGGRAPSPEHRPPSPVVLQ